MYNRQWSHWTIFAIRLSSPPGFSPGKNRLSQAYSKTSNNIIINRRNTFSKDV